MAQESKPAVVPKTRASSQGALPGVFALIGFTAVIAQVVLMRELLVVFQGNEVSIGITLAGWLFWTAVGSGVAGRAAPFPSHPRRWVAILQLLIACSLPVTVAGVRLSKPAMQTVAGEILGPGQMLLTSALSMSLFCVLSGWLFAAASRLLRIETQAGATEATGRVYLYEAVGSMAGGLVTSLLLVRHFDSFQSAALAAWLNLAAAGWLLAARPRRGRVVASAVVAGAALLLPYVAGRLNRFTEVRLWQGFRLVATRTTIYGHLAVTETETARTLFENGLSVMTVPDLMAAEEAVHYALLQHPNPRRLLLIGGGVNGSAGQALLHPSLMAVDYVELDPGILEVARGQFPDDWQPIEADPRLRVHQKDGRQFVKTATHGYDVIIVNLPDPKTAQLNRFYTLEFFREASRILHADGLLSFAVTGSETYIGPERAEFLRCIAATLEGVYPEIKVFPGETIHFFAAKRPGALTVDPQVLLSRLRDRMLKTVYVREYLLPFRLMPARVAELEAQIAPRPETALNRDFSPLAYYLNVAHWTTQFGEGSSRWLRDLARVEYGRLAAAVCLALLAMSTLLCFGISPSRRPSSAAGFCVAAMGFTLIGFEVQLLLAFQAIYGYVYYQLAVIIAGFMAGMALGSWLGLRGAGAGAPAGQGARTLVGLEAVAVVAPPVLCLLFEACARLTDQVALVETGALLFPALAVLCGLLGGYQFPVASRVFFGDDAGAAPRALGTLYALDLAGACLAALALSTYVIPVFGFWKSALLLSLINVWPAISVALSQTRRARFPR